MECRIHRLTAGNKLWAESSVGRTPTPGLWVTVKTFHRASPASDVKAAFVSYFASIWCTIFAILCFQSFILFFRCRLASLIRILIRILKNMIILYYIPLGLLNKRVFLQVRIDSLILVNTESQIFFLSHHTCPVATQPTLFRCYFTAFFTENWISHL